MYMYMQSHAQTTEQSGNETGGCQGSRCWHCYITSKPHSCLAYCVYRGIISWGVEWSGVWERDYVLLHRLLVQAED